jgi:putative hydrolase of the HAD superfamily
VSVRHVLLDADGVLQRHPVGWVAAASSYVGEDGPALFAAVTGHERDLLRGDGDFLPVLAAELRRRGHEADPAEVYAGVWLRIDTVPETVELARELRGRGLGVHLATNQQAGRAAHMRTALGYDELLDRGFYSCELGAAKPEPAFFHAVLDALGAAPPEVLLVDDSEANVVGAREVGLAGVHWHYDEGIQALHDRLAAHLG